jgi:hypothetical protein
MNSCFARIGFVVVMLAMLLIGGFLLISVATEGFDDTFDRLFSAPRDLFCDVTGLCESSEETELVDSEIVWTRISERSLLDLGKFEQNGRWRAERNLLIVTNSMSMSGTVNITMAMNLGFITQEDITVTQDDPTVIIQLPPVQTAECFMTDVEYSDRFCIEVCDDLERDLQRKAIEQSLGSDELQQALQEALENAKVEIAKLIDIGNISDQDYRLQFSQKTETPPPIAGATCPGN